MNDIYIDEKLKEAGKALIEIAQKTRDEEYREKAIDILGPRDYMKIKISEGMELWGEDKDLLLWLLNRN